MPRRRRLAVFGSIVAAAVIALAVVDRSHAAIVLFAVGVLLLVPGSFSGMWRGHPRWAMGMEPELQRVFRRDMEQRRAWQRDNLVLVAAGALLIGLATLLELA